MRAFMRRTVYPAMCDGKPPYPVRPNRSSPRLNRGSSQTPAIDRSSVHSAVHGAGSGNCSAGERRCRRTGGAPRLPPLVRPASVAAADVSGRIATVGSLRAGCNDSCDRCGASCLPLAIAVAMHLYPFCVLQCVPIPLLSVARLKRAMLLHTIRNRSLILANTGSERSNGTTTPPIATRAPDGVRIDGRCEYLSLSSVADIVLFKAQLADSNHAVLCAADLRASTVRIGQWKFSGAMELSDTSSVTFVDHRVPDGHYLIVPDDAGLGCITDYQRSLVSPVHRGDLSRASRASAQHVRHGRTRTTARVQRSGSPQAAVAASARRLSLWVRTLDR